MLRPIDYIMAAVYAFTVTTLSMIASFIIVGSCIAVIIVLCSTAAAAQPHVIDGDTLVINNVHYRIEGIDAPESRQACSDGWPAGYNATMFLRALSQSGAKCNAVSVDKYGRTIAQCNTADGYDMGYALVRAGYAFAYTHYSKRHLVIAEKQAKAENIGVHLHNCEKPWEWRRKHESIRH
jgi:endonuclease YncB( thermonuclease family)